jgi:hypothetical protein
MRHRTESSRRDKRQQKSVFEGSPADGARWFMAERAMHRRVVDSPRT